MFSQLCTFSALLLLAIPIHALEKIEIKTLRGQMKYDTESFTVSPGAKVQLSLKNEDDMHHNLIICKPGKGIEQELAKKAWELGADGFEKQWIPEHPALLFATPMADPQKSVTLEFTAPEKTGIYPYVCTLPGHSMIMNGKMIVGEGGAPKGKNGLSELTFMLYKGKWEMLPNFSQLTPVATDHVKGGLITLKVANKLQNHFGIVFRAKLTIPANGKYTFDLRSDDGSKLLIGGKEILAHDGIHGASGKTAEATLAKGTVDLELQYFEGAGGEELVLTWSGSGFKNLPLTDGKKSRNDKAPPTGLPLAPSGNEAVIYRNFIEGAGARAIGVGYPGGANIAYDADQCRLALAWQGAFIDAARHWTGRGQGFQPPLGYNLVNMPEGSPLARLDSLNDPWPNDARQTSKQRPENGYKFAGYKLVGESRVPEFRFHYHDARVTDLFEASATMKGKHANLARLITVLGKLEGTHYFRAAVGKTITKTRHGNYLVDDKVVIGFTGSATPMVRTSGSSQELLVPIKGDHDTAQIEQTIRWK